MATSALMRVALEPMPGVVSDDTDFASEGAWVDIDKMRFWRGRPQSIGGWEAAFADLLGGVCRNVISWTDGEGEPNMAFGTHLTLEVYVGGVLYDITPSGLIAGEIDSSGAGPGWGSGAWGEGAWSTPSSVTNARTWAFDTWGENLLANPFGETVFQWENDTGTDAAAIANAPDEVSFMLVTQERQCLVFGCNEVGSGNFNGLCIRGCEIEDLTDWTPTSSNNAFEHILEGGGYIVAAAKMGAYVAVWTNTAVHLGQFIGDKLNVYRFDRVDDNCGLIGPNALHVDGQTAYWIAPDKQFRVWTLGLKPEIIDCPVRNDFKDNLVEAQQRKIVATSIHQYGEIWWHYPDGRDGTENSRYVAVGNLSGKGLWWTRGILPRTAFCDAGVADHPIGVDVDGVVYYHEKGLSANGEALDGSITFGDQYLDESRYVLQIQGIKPDFEDQRCDVDLVLSLKFYPQAEAVTKGPHTLMAGAGKKDFFATGAIASGTFSYSSTTAFVRFGKPLFDAVVSGQR